MRRLFLFVATMALVVVLAAACGNDGDKSDEAAVRNVVLENTAATNDRDFDRWSETITANFETNFGFPTLLDNPEFRIEDLSILSVSAAGDEATVIASHQGTHSSTDTFLLKREDGRWLIDDIIE